MIRSARRAAVLLAFCVLTSVATACAECAWVLWFNPEANVHVVESAHSSVTECDVALVDMRAVLRNDGYKVYGGSTSSDHVLLGERGVEHIMYRCLPDTVDPRGPKGK
jgi:hypothetical protein